MSNILPSVAGMETKRKYRISLGRKIRKLRLAKEPYLSQKKLAGMSKVSLRYLNMIETGSRKNIGHQILQRLADALEIQFSELIED